MAFATEIELVLNLKKCLLIISKKKLFFANQIAPPANRSKKAAKNPANQKGGCSCSNLVMPGKI